MSFEITGTVVEVYPTTEVSSKFRKREFVIEKKELTNNFEFIDYIKFQVTQDKCSLLDPLATGDEVKVTFNLRGRKWEKDGNLSYFTNLEAWKVEKSSAASNHRPVKDIQQNDDIPFPAKDDFYSEEQAENDLPF